MGDLLRIDLATGEVREEAIPEERLRALIGAKGIGARMLLEEIAPETDPLGPDNKLIFAIGPISGTQMAGSNRYGVFFLSPLTGGYGECYSGGKLTPQFAGTGYKVVVLEGKAARPVFVEVREGGGVVHDASDLWGLDTYAAEEQVLARVGDPKAQACVIGPAGENLLRFACIENNKWRSLGRGGAGAVMGSKNVKGVAFHGSRKPEVARPEVFKRLVRDLAEAGKNHPTVNAYKSMGTVQMVRATNGMNMFPTRYWQKGRLDDFEPLSAETMNARWKVKNTICPPCFIACGNLCRVPDDYEDKALAGLEMEGPEFETIYVFGGLCEIVDWAQIMRLNDICDRLGIDTMTAGNLCGLAIEACRQGKLDLGLDYGDADGVAEFLGMMARREGVGDVFAEGILRAEKELGLEGVAVHVKGMEPAGYDPRVSKGMALGYITSARGACHLRATIMKAELSGLIPIDAVEGKAAIYVEWEDRFAIMDSLISCRFYRDLEQWPFLLEVVNAAAGTDYTQEELRAIGAGIITDSHRFNELRGFGRAQERLPAWVTERPLYDEDGREQLTTATELETMLREYYAARGWGTPPA
jgi:aldehyde:ferredoxin oxidoreductase